MEKTLRQILSYPRRSIFSLTEIRHEKSIERESCRVERERGSARAESPTSDRKKHRRGSDAVAETEQRL